VVSRITQKPHDPISPIANAWSRCTSRARALARQGSRPESAHFYTNTRLRYHWKRALDAGIADGSPRSRLPPSDNVRGFQHGCKTSTMALIVGAGARATAWRSWLVRLDAEASPVPWTGRLALTGQWVASQAHVAGRSASLVWGYTLLFPERVKIALLLERGCG
jgi:hypothetical protein